MPDVTGTFYAAAAIVGYGAQWEIGSGTSPETFQAVEQVVSITPGQMTTAVADKTHLRSPAAHREKVATIRDSAPFAIKLIWNPKGQSQSKTGGGTGSFSGGGLVELWINRTERNMRINLNDGSPSTDWPFRGVITKFQPGQITVDNLIEVDVEVTPLQDFSSNLP